MPAVNPTRTPSAAEMKDLVAAMAARAGGAAKPAEDAGGGLVLSANPDGSIKVPDLGLPQGPATSQRFDFDIPLERRDLVPTVKEAIDGIGQLTKTSISTDVKTIGFHDGEHPVTGIVRGTEGAVANAIKAIQDLAAQVS